MATRKKAKGKSKTKGKKRSLTKATSKKTKTVRKKRAKKTLVRRTAKKSRAKVNVAVKTTPDPSSTLPGAVAATPHTQPALVEERIGAVTHYYSHLSVATVRLEAGILRIGDVIRILGHTTDFTQRVESLEVNHASVTQVGPGDDFGLKVDEHVREHDVVFKVLR